MTVFSSVFVFQVQATSDGSDEQIVVLETSMGNITIQLRDDMPITAGNFLRLLNDGVYDARAHLFNFIVCSSKITHWRIYNPAFSFL